MSVSQKKISKFPFPFPLKGNKLCLLGYMNSFVGKGVIRYSKSFLIDILSSFSLCDYHMPSSIFLEELASKGRFSNLIVN
jgi:hypothetical protein